LAGRGVAQVLDRDIWFEAVAATRDRFDETRPIVSEGPAKFADALHQCIVGHGNIRPNCSKQFILRHKTTGILNQVDKNAEGLGPQHDLSRPAQEAPSIQIQDIETESQALLH